VQVAEAAAQDTADPTALEPVARAGASAPAATGAAAGSGAAATSSVTQPEILTYPDRLDDDSIPPETLGEPIDPTAVARRSRATAVPPPVKAKEIPAKPVPPAPASAANARTVTAPSPAAETPAPARAASDPGGSGFVVQVAAVRERAAADTIAKRLSAKGYPSFVTTSGAGAPRVFRVRVGKYRDRRAAETIKTRLEKEEQFKPWITK
jgi:cell division septation protein DedD